MENNRTYQETKGPDTEDRAPKGQGKKNRGMFFILLVILVIALFLGLIGFLTDWLWFKELDYVRRRISALRRCGLKHCSFSTVRTSD